MTVPIKSLIRNINIVVGCTHDCPYCYARCNCARFRMTEDFSVPVFMERKLSLLDSRSPGTYLLTGMSDLADWEDGWTDAVLDRAAGNPDKVFLFLTKRPSEVRLDTDLDNVWVGVTVTRQSEAGKFTELRDSVRCRHYHATLEPLHGPVEGMDLDGYEWLVVGTETGRRRGKVDAEPSWVDGVVRQADARGIPVFMKEELARIVGEDGMRQELPPSFVPCGGCRWS